MQVQPYLLFDGRCEEALEFYRKALGARVEALIRFKDSPDPQMCVPGAGDKVMHTCFRGFSLSLSVADDEDAKRRFGVSWAVVANSTAAN